jgi:uncharacterized protein YkwD
MSRRFSRPALGYLVALLLFASPAVASADSTTVTVVNSAGVPQADTQLRVNSGFAGATDGGGSRTLTVWPGEVIQATRDYNGNPSDPCNAPEQEGVKATVSYPIPAAITITVPDANTSATYQSQLGSSERKFVGLVNQLRAQQSPPLPPVYISNTLVDTTSRYISVVPQAGAPNPHCLLSGPRTRMINSGFPGFPGGEIMSWGAYDAASSFYGFEHSPPHLAIMLGSKFNAIGVAVNGDVWVADFAYLNPADPWYYRAQMTTDTGDPNLPEDNLAPSRKEGAEESENGFGDPGLKFKRLRVRGHQLRVTLTLAREAVQQGRVVLIARQQRQRRSLALNSTLEARVKLGAGRWSLQAKFIPKTNGVYLGSVITRRLQIPKPRKRVRP